MTSRDIEIRGEGQDIAVRNEEINRTRMARGNHTGPLKVTDPTAFARLMADMQRKAEEQRQAEAQREAERAKREGANYKNKAEREREAREAKQHSKGEDEAKHVERRFDPGKNYYSLLGVDRCASTAEIKRAYKKLALAYHPDKHKTHDEEQQTAIADKFKQVVEAFDVLTDEAQRAVYDKIQDYKETNPGRGLPVLSPEEMAMMSSGAAELRRLRRMGPKLTKHRPLERDESPLPEPPLHSVTPIFITRQAGRGWLQVWMSLKKLNGGGMKRVTVTRQRVDADGSLIQHTRTYHLVIRKGMQEGDRVTFEGEGEEAVDTHPGDLIFVLRQKLHPLFKRSGRSNLEVFARALSPGDLLFGIDLTTLQGKRCLLRGSAWGASTATGCGGGLWQSMVPGQGLHDPQDPWDNPPGDLVVQVRYPGFKLGPGCVSTCLAPRPLHLLGSATCWVPAAILGGFLAASIIHHVLAAELWEGDYDGSSLARGSGERGAGGESGKGGGEGIGKEGDLAGVGLQALPDTPPQKAAGGRAPGGEVEGGEVVAEAPGGALSSIQPGKGESCRSPSPGTAAWQAPCRSPLAVCLTWVPPPVADAPLLLGSGAQEEEGCERRGATEHASHCKGCAHEEEQGAGKGGAAANTLVPSPAAAALLRVLRSRVAGMQGRVLPISIQLCPACTASLPGTAQQGAAGLAQQGAAEGCSCMEGLLDDEWVAVHAADVIIVDVAPDATNKHLNATASAALSETLGVSEGRPSLQHGMGVGSSLCKQRCAQGAIQAVHLEQQHQGDDVKAGGGWQHRSRATRPEVDAAETMLCWAQRSAQGNGLMQALVSAFWSGAVMVGVGGGCALLGRLPPQQPACQLSAGGAQPRGQPPAILPWYVVRAGGGEGGWEGLHSALRGGARLGWGGAAESVVGVGVMAGSACTVDPTTGCAELLVAPPRDAMVATACWAAAQRDSCGEQEGQVQEAEEDYGFFYAIATH